MEAALTSAITTAQLHPPTKSAMTKTTTASSTSHAHASSSKTNTVPKMICVIEENSNNIVGSTPSPKITTSSTVIDQYSRSSGAPTNDVHRKPQQHHQNDDDSADNSRPGTGFRRRRLTCTAHTILPNTAAVAAAVASALPSGAADDDQFADAEDDDIGDGGVNSHASKVPPTEQIVIKRPGLNLSQAAAMVAAEYASDDDEVEVPIQMDPMRNNFVSKSGTSTAAPTVTTAPTPERKGPVSRRLSDYGPVRGANATAAATTSSSTNKTQTAQHPMSQAAALAAAEFDDDDDDDDHTDTPPAATNGPHKRPLTPPPAPPSPTMCPRKRARAASPPPEPPCPPSPLRHKPATEMTLVQKPDEEFVLLQRSMAPQRRLSKDEEDGLLPFPRDLVGTYSCHGVEPLYDVYEYEGGEEDKEEVGPTTVAKINQDRGSVAFPYGNCPRTALFAAYDGHGEGGELVAQFAMTEIQRRLHKHPLFMKDVDTAFRHTFIEVDKALRTQNSIEPLYSGSTACAVLIRDNTLTISNVGDSRAVLARRRKNSSALTPINLSIDQNPDSPGEQDRIERCGGFVSPPPEEGLSARVWLDPEFTQIGLAMSRSIGDHAVKRIGVIAEPVVTTHELTNEDEFMIIATDGVWEFIDSEEAITIVGQYFAYGDGASRACQGLIEVAASKWHEHEGDYRDDITALVVRIRDVRQWWM